MRRVGFPRARDWAPGLQCIHRKQWDVEERTLPGEDFAPTADGEDGHAGEDDDKRGE